MLCEESVFFLKKSDPTCTNDFVLLKRLQAVVLTILEKSLADKQNNISKNKSITDIKKKLGKLRQISAQFWFVLRYSAQGNVI